MGFLIPLIQCILLGLHYFSFNQLSNLLLNTLFIALSMILALVNMIFIMSAHKRKQIKVFHEDHTREDRMIEKIEEAKDHSKLHATMKNKIRRDKEHDEMSYKAFINLYFSCFRGQNKQTLLILVNWFIPLLVANYLLNPLIGIGINGTATIMILFSTLLVFLFSLVTYFYALYLKTKVEAQIIEEFVHRHKKDIF